VAALLFKDWNIKIMSPLFYAVYIALIYIFLVFKQIFEIEAEIRFYIFNKFRQKIKKEKYKKSDYSLKIYS